MQPPPPNLHGGSVKSLADAGNKISGLDIREDYPETFMSIYFISIYNARKIKRLITFKARTFSPR